MSRRFGPLSWRSRIADLEREKAILEKANHQHLSTIERHREQLAAANARTRALRSRIAGYEEDAPDDPDLRYLFVVTYGRSGSTLLQGILNSIPGYLIRGENGGVLYNVFEGHAIATREGHRRRNGTDGENAWFGIEGYRQDLAALRIRQYAVSTLLRPEPDTRVTGFKEVRWEMDDLGRYVTFLQAVFPEARFVFNTRDHAQVARSKWWASHDNAEEIVSRIERRQLRVRERIGEAGFHLHYNDYVDDLDGLRPLFEWLGEPYDEARLRTVLEKPHSY